MRNHDKTLLGLDKEFIVSCLTEHKKERIVILHELIEAMKSRVAGENMDVIYERMSELLIKSGYNYTPYALKRLYYKRGLK